MFLVQNEFHNMYQFGWHFLITTNMLGKKWIGDLKFQIGFANWGLTFHLIESTN